MATAPPDLLLAGQKFMGPGDPTCGWHLKWVSLDSLSTLLMAPALTSGWLVQKWIAIYQLGLKQNPLHQPCGWVLGYGPRPTTPVLPPLPPQTLLGCPHSILQPPEDRSIRSQMNKSFKNFILEIDFETFFYELLTTFALLQKYHFPLILYEYFMANFTITVPLIRCL